MAAEQNIEGATQTYTGFVALMKWGTIGALALGALVVVLIAS